MRVERVRARRDRACRDQKHTGDLLRRLGQRHAVLECVDDSFARLQADDFMERWPIEVKIDQRHSAPVSCRDARDVPGGLAGPVEVRGVRDQRDERLPVHERRNQMAEARERELAHGAHCPGW
jgi:hypothetical protein